MKGSRKKAAEAAEFIWRGYSLRTVGDLTDALYSIVRRNQPWEARLFHDRYRERVGKSADTNIAYCLGYLRKEHMVAGLRLFDLKHPYFGSADEAKRVTAQQALLLGIEAAQASALDAAIEMPDPRPKRQARKRRQ